MSPMVMLRQLRRMVICELPTIRAVMLCYRVLECSDVQERNTTDSVTPNSVCGCANQSLARKRRRGEEQLLHLQAGQLSASQLANPCP